MYHPFELAFGGFAGSGKTPLMCHVLRHWGSRYRVGYAKRGTDSIILDTDAYEASRAGAAASMTNGANRLTHTSERPSSHFDRTYAFVDVDFVLAEGHTKSALTKLLVLDDAGRALDAFVDGQFENVIGLIGSTDEPPAATDVPYFRRQQIRQIAAFVEDHMRSLADAPLFGAVLVGGKSRRMGEEKWALAYRNEPHALQTAELLGNVCEKVFIAARSDQQLDGLSHLPVIADSYPSWGPSAGILSAMHAHPEAAWLVAACDLPFLDEQTLVGLVNGRNPFRIATAFKNPGNDLPEPLCAIWEPRAAQRLLQAAGIGIRCPRKVLIESAPELLELSNPRALDNANTPEESRAARSALENH